MASDLCGRRRYHLGVLANESLADTPALQFYHRVQADHSHQDDDHANQVPVK
jgi:hypothetical protein